MEYEYDTPLAAVNARSVRKRHDCSSLASVNALSSVDENLYDVVVIDCPPQLGYLTFIRSDRSDCRC